MKARLPLAIGDPERILPAAAELLHVDPTFLAGCLPNTKHIFLGAEPRRLQHIVHLFCTRASVNPYAPVLPPRRALARRTR